MLANKTILVFLNAKWYAADLEPTIWCRSQKADACLLKKRVNIIRGMVKYVCDENARCSSLDRPA